MKRKKIRRNSESIKGATVLTSEDGGIDRFRLASIKHGLKARKIGMFITRGATTAKLMAMLSEYTGVKYKRTDLDKAIADAQRLLDADVNLKTQRDLAKGLTDNRKNRFFGAKLKRGIRRPKKGRMMFNNAENRFFGAKLKGGIRRPKKGRMMFNNAGRTNEIITKDHEYYDDVYYVWRPVPSFWIGDFVGSHSYKIGLFTKSKDSALRKNSTHERGMVNPDLSTSERDQDFSPLKKLVMDLASDFAPVVKDIEGTRYSTTQNNYGRYMSLISSMSKGDKKRAEIIAMALITAGANRSGVKSALRVMFGE